MSLEIYAKHLADQGRGPDDTLVHMSRGEVKSLNDLAMAHGGQLTINPKTGLPEAGFLTALLPMIAGAALAPATGGASLGLTSAWQTAALVGAGAYALNPKGGLMGGLKAGLGAYGGAGLGEALAQQGMQQATAEELAKSQAGISNVVGNAGTQGLPAGISPDQYAKNVLTQTQPYVDARTAAQTAFDAGSFTDRLGTVGQGAKTLASPGGFSNLVTNLGGGFKTASTVGAALSPAIADSMKATPPPAPTPDKDMGQRYSYSPGLAQPLPSADVPSYDTMLTQQGNFGKQQNYYPNQGYTRVSPDEAKNLYGFAAGGPVEQMSNNAAIGANTMYPMANMATSAFATPYQDPKSTNMMSAMNPSGGGTVDQMSGEPNMQGTRLAEGGIAKYGFGGFLGDAVSDIGSNLGHMFKGGDDAGWAHLEEVMGGKPKQDAMTAAGYSYNPQTQQYQQMATGGISDAHYNLGGYSDGGRLLRGPGDGVSDSIPASIGHKQPARLADGEFVVPARIVSELGNGSTEAGARKLYAMMDRVQSARRQTVGKGRVAKNSRADKYLPA
jgi:hypothetical protein